MRRSQVLSLAKSGLRRYSEREIDDRKILFSWESQKTLCTRIGQSIGTTHENQVFTSSISTLNINIFTSLISLSEYHLWGESQRWFRFLNKCQLIDQWEWIENLAGFSKKSQSLHQREPSLSTALGSRFQITRKLHENSNIFNRPRRSYWKETEARKSRGTVF